jgi:hypothetical protein
MIPHDSGSCKGAHHIKPTEVGQGVTQLFKQFVIESGKPGPPD